VVKDNSLLIHNQKQNSHRYAFESLGTATSFIQWHFIRLHLQRLSQADSTTMASIPDRVLTMTVGAWFHPMSPGSAALHAMLAKAKDNSTKMTA